MSDSSIAHTESLLQEEPRRSARCGGKAFVFLAFVVGLSFGALLAVSVTGSGGSTINEPTIDMAALQSMQALKVPVIRPPQALPFMKAPSMKAPSMATPSTSAITGPNSRRDSIRMNAYHNPTALAGSGVSPISGMDARDALGLSPGQKPPKCFGADKHASLCGNLVVLRPSTALRATSGGDSGIDADKILADVSDRWDKLEDKTSFVLYSGGAVVALILVNSIVSTVNNIPLIPGLLETVGLGYSAYFAYRYLLTKSSRQELVADIDELKKKISE